MIVAAGGTVRPGLGGLRVAIRQVQGFRFSYDGAAMNKNTAVLLLTLALSPLLHAQANVDPAAAQALMRQNNCTRCHAVDKEKEGPPFSKVAGKYRGKSDAEDKLVHHLTSGGKAKFADGHEEDHKVIKTAPANDMAQVKNLVQWILSH